MRGLEEDSPGRGCSKESSQGGEPREALNAA